MSEWFTEQLAIVPGMRAQISVEKCIASERSAFQKLEVYQTTSMGRMLVLDDVIQCTEFDEQSYHEMICHVPLFSHPNPQKVLIIGGGDGGSVRECLKHKSVTEVHLCEIDRRVVDLCVEHIPSMAGKVNDPRVHCHYEDGAAWAKNHPGTYDVIIVDSSDPIGPAEVLFQFPFYESCCNALTPDGILATQAENFLLHGKIIKELLSFGKKLFPVARYYYTQVPTYPGGMIGFTFFSRKHGQEDLVDSRYAASGMKPEDFRFWSPDFHKKAFTLPGAVMRDFYGA
jgi:spermidine synthase